MLNEGMCCFYDLLCMVIVYNETDLLVRT